ncbi:TatD family hydrolase [Phormidium yuhuli AB48]|uniref:D-aminoacyl-tRNA deacylase n=1 Tax=Phormidium yuhuli AB48 TaxID=2940671 RepID=A0ABY5ARE4_9CYAN|nr:TatD family hydrolase [Phormidium yuhuli]USR91341.1 TatD family hydrolase [Phormidium yuhuli AB48]
MTLIDTHVHVNFDRFEADFEQVRDRWRAAGVSQLIHSCVHPREFSRTQAIAAQVPELSLAVGLHPLEAQDWTEDLAREIHRLAQEERRVVAIGETGLDFFKSDNRPQQTAALQGQLKIAQALNLPVIIHCRDAASALVEELQQFRTLGAQPRGVMHCWAGTPEETQAFLDLGFYISFSGIVTFKNAQTLQESAKLVPDDRLLIETDCPFLAPVPKRGKRNEPAFVRHVAETLAQLRGVSFHDLAEQTRQNAIACFSLNPV